MPKRCNWWTTHIFCQLQHKCPPLTRTFYQPNTNMPRFTGADSPSCHCDWSLLSMIQYLGTLPTSTICMTSIYTLAECRSPCFWLQDISQYMNLSLVQHILPSANNNCQSPTLISRTSLPLPSPANSHTCMYVNMDSYIKNNMHHQQYLWIPMERWLQQW